MKEPESLFELYKEAVFQKDLEAFASIFDEKVRVFDMWQSWSYEGLDAWREMAKNWFSSLGNDKDLISFDEIQIQTSSDIAVATAFVRFTAISEKGEELRYLENRLTWVMRKKGEFWKIIHQHTSGPVDVDKMQVILNR